MKYDKSSMIEQFQQLLNQAETEDSDENLDQPVGLTQVFTELAVLKTEVRTEARQFKSALESLQTLTDRLTKQQQDWDNERQRYREALDTASRQTLQPILLELLGIRDRQVAAVNAWDRFRPGFFKRMFVKKELRLLSSFAEGQALILTRFDHLLEKHGVKPIDTIGQRFDPMLMRAAELVVDRKRENGIVISEVTQGFFWNDDVLRLAEVVVNKLDEK